MKHLRFIRVSSLGGSILFKLDERPKKKLVLTNVDIEDQGDLLRLSKAFFESKGINVVGYNSFETNYYILVLENNDLISEMFLKWNN